MLYLHSLIIFTWGGLVWVAVLLDMFSAEFDNNSSENSPAPRKMVKSDEKNPALTKPPSSKGIGRRMFGSEVSQNIVAAGAPPLVVNKRGLPELLRKICKENMPDHQVHRPISRSFIAQMGSTQHQFSVESKRINTSVQDSIRVEDCNLIICADEKNDAKDQPEPMFLEQTDQIVKHEMGQMEEVKMKDLCEDPVMDIDTCDVKNPLEIVDYVEDIYAYYKKMECSGCVPPDYMAQQFDINGKMRDILIDWLIEIFSPAKSGQREASVGSACARKELLDMERLMLKTLQFNLSCPTPYVFMRRFLKAAQSDKKLEILSFFLIDLCLVEYEMLKFPPSLLAASAIYTAQCTLHGFKQWDKKCQWYTGYSEDELLECSVLIVTFHQKAGTGKLIGLQRKYSASRFGFTAKYEPAKFLLEGIQV